MLDMNAGLVIETMTKGKASYKNGTFSFIFNKKNKG